MGIGHKAVTIKWDYISIENLYWETVLPQRKDLKFSNPDIESEYCSSILFNEYHWIRLSYVNISVDNCLVFEKYL